MQRFLILPILIDAYQQVYRFNVTDISYYFPTKGGTLIRLKIGEWFFTTVPATQIDHAISEVQYPVQNLTDYASKQVSDK